MSTGLIMSSIRFELRRNGAEKRALLDVTSRMAAPRNGFFLSSRILIDNRATGRVGESLRNLAGHRG